MSSTIKEFKNKKFVWLDITKASHDNLKYLKQKFGFDSVDLNDCLPTRQRQKIHLRKKYIFIILQFPVYNRQTGVIESAEVDCFIGKKYLITMHDGELKPLTDFFHLCQTDQLIKSKIENEDIASLINQLLTKIYLHCYPILNHININISQIEKDILDQPEEKTIRNILLIKRSIVNFQKTMQSHHGILHKLLEFL